LQELSAEFEKAGIGIVAITYDTPELQQIFIDAAAITYPFLSDIDIESFAALQILNDEHSPGDKHYGLPFPGIFVLNPEREIVGKIFVERYQIRVDAETTLEYALEVLDAQ
jgi:peroxiredoxin